MGLGGHGVADWIGNSLAGRKTTVGDLVKSGAEGCVIGALFTLVGLAAEYLFDGAALEGEAASGEAATGTALARQLGREGEDLIEGAGNTTRIPLANGGYRIPDILDEAGGVMGEVKNVARLS